MSWGEENLIHEPRITKFKGKPILKIPIGGGYGFGFGLTKAKAILEHIKEIEKFVDTNGKEF